MKNKSEATSFMSILAAALLLDACAAPAPTVQAEISLMNGLEYTITLETPAQKIITLSPPLTEILYAIGAGEQVIGRDSHFNSPEAALALPDIGGGYSEYSLETILSLEPDLAIDRNLYRNAPDRRHLARLKKDMKFIL